MARDALFAFARTLSFEEDEALEKLTYWGEGGDGRSTSAASRAEAYASIEAVFGKYLPQQYKTWDDLDTDAGIAELCIVGVGSWYLKASRSAAAAGHDVPRESAFECNIEYMSRYVVPIRRERVPRYGACRWQLAAASRRVELFTLEALHTVGRAVGACEGSVQGNSRRVAHLA